MCLNHTQEYYERCGLKKKIESDDDLHNLAAKRHTNACQKNQSRLIELKDCCV